MAQHDPLTAPISALRLTALSLADTAKVLSRIGARPVTEETLRADIDAGAPVNSDGTVNLIQYAAWLLREQAHAD